MTVLLLKKMLNSNLDPIQAQVGLLANHFQNQINLVKVEALFFPMMILLIGFSNILVIFIGGNQYIQGEIEIGVLAEFIIYVNSILLLWCKYYII